MSKFQNLIENLSHTGNGTPSPVSLPGLLSAEMHTTTVMLGPSEATTLLSKNTGNRKVYKSRVEKYARMMALGQWVLSPDGVSIAPNGRILQGQHRLLAIVKSNCTVPMRITFNVPEGVYPILDTCKTRSLQDRMGINDRQAQCAKAMHRGLNTNVRDIVFSDRDMDIYYTTHALAIDFAVNISESTTHGLKRPQLAAVLARASYTVKDTVLERFAKIVIEGAAALDQAIKPGERTALALREHILKMHPASGGHQGYKLYGCIERALRAFEQNKELKSKLTPVSREQYPLPSDKSLDANPAAS